MSNTNVKFSTNDSLLGSYEYLGNKVYNSDINMTSQDNNF
jgi:hypothetical protein